MLSLLPAVILLLLALGGVVVRKTCYTLPLIELKRRAKITDPFYIRLYRLVAYGNSLRALLWLYIGLTSAGSIILLARFLPVWASLLVVGPLLWLTFAWLPASRVSSFGVWLTKLVAPVIAWLLNYLHTPLSHLAEPLTGRYTAKPHTGLFERADLLKLLDRQRSQEDSRLSPEELDALERSLHFNDLRAAEIMTPAKQVKSVLAGDTVGPVLIDELHHAGQPIIPVKESAKGDFVGVLPLAKLNLKSTGQVRDLMEPATCFVNEDDNLTQVMQAFFATLSPLFIVINNFEEYVGILSVEDVIMQLLGSLAQDDFDQFSNAPAVARRHTVTDSEESVEATAEIPAETTTELATEDVVE